MKRTTSPKDLYFDAIRLPRHELLRILEELDKKEADDTAAVQRSESRHTHQDHPDALMIITYPEGEPVWYRVVVRDLSTHGISVLHGKFAYPGSPCKLVMRDSEGDLATIPGTIVRCRHLEGRVHELGVKFDDPIDLSRVLGELGVEAPE